MRIAYLNPWVNAAENQAYFSLEKAGHSVGIDLVPCSTPEDAERSGAEFILSVSSSVPKVVDIPSYLTVHEPSKRFLSRAFYMNNLLSYDGYFTISDSLERFVKDVCFGTRRYAGVGFYYNSPQISTLRSDLAAITDRGQLHIVYIGTNWDNRAPTLLRTLDTSRVLRVHGPERSWANRDLDGYAGPLPWDGEAPQQAYAEAGMGLVLLSADHLREDVVSNRILEITSVGAVAVCPRIPWIEKWFGDSVMYFTPSRSGSSMASDITRCVSDVKRDPSAAAARAHRAREIFEETFAAERMLENAAAYHEQARSAHATRRSHLPAEPRISVVVRCGGRPELLKGAVDSIRRQTYGAFTVILAEHDELDASEILEDQSGRIQRFVEAKAIGGGRAETLIAGLKEVDTEFFAVLDDDDFWLSDHVETLFTAGATADPTFDVVYSGAVGVAPTGTEIEIDLFWSRNISHFGLEPNPTRVVDVTKDFTSNCFVARSALLPPDLEILGGIETAEDSLLEALVARNKRPVFSYKPTAFYRRGFEGESSYLTSESRRRDVSSLNLRTSMLLRPVWLAGPSSTLRQGDGRLRRGARHLAQVRREQGIEVAFREAQPLARIWLREQRATAAGLMRSLGRRR
jgi:hypothetical protein